MFKKAVTERILKEKKSLTELLQETLQKQWDEVKTEMFKFPYFETWPESAVRQCYVNSNLRTYSKNEIIKDKDSANVPIAHFILEGECIVVQRLIVKVSHVGGKTVYTLSKDEDLKRGALHNYQCVFMQTSHLREGACFGLGENLSKHIILTTTEVKTLIIPRHLLLQTFTPNNIWRRIILFLDMNYPKREEVFKGFLRGRRWIDYKRRVSNDPTIKRVANNMSIHDTPLMSRLPDPTLAHKWKRAERDPLFLQGDKEYLKNVTAHEQKGGDVQEKFAKMSFIKVHLESLEEDEETDQ